MRIRVTCKNTTCELNKWCKRYKGESGQTEFKPFKSGEKWYCEHSYSK